jgi:DNA repair protein RAD7
LTDFLASHNISAQQIQHDYNQRVAAAQQQAAADAAVSATPDAENGSSDGEDAAERAKRKRKAEKALLKIKQSKEFKRRKFEREQDGDISMNDDDLAREMMASNKPMPGQLDNCDLCEKRFTVTPYSKTGPNGGLLCGKCSKELKDEEKKEAAAQKRKTAVPRGRKRQTESDRMMGDVKPGAKALVDMCVRKVANVVNDIEAFGDMPQSLLDRLSQILSKNRILTSRVLELFLRDDVDRISIYDCGKLETEDFQKIFGTMPHLEIVNLRFAGQMKDPQVMYLADKCRKIRHLQLGATNLVTDAAWMELFTRLGPQLESLKLSELNDSLRDDVVELVAKKCRNLRRLKLRSCAHITEVGIDALLTLKSLEHLTLAIAPETSVNTLNNLISTFGPKLRTLCLENFTEFDDSCLDTIKQSCPKLSKLRVCGSRECTDAVFASLFDHSCPFPGLTSVDLSENRDMNDDMHAHDDEDTTPDPDEEDTAVPASKKTIGFGSLAFQSLMTHSGSSLTHLNLKSDRHISHFTLLNVFDGIKSYPNLRTMDLSFVKSVDDVIMAGIFRSCPNLAKLAVFACFNARGARIPPGIAVVGLPNAGQSILQGDLEGLIEI